MADYNKKGSGAGTLEPAFLEVFGRL